MSRHILAADSHKELIKKIEDYKTKHKVVAVDRKEILGVWRALIVKED